jgi:hypothetical protein
MSTNLAIAVVVGLLVALLGVRDFLLVQTPITPLASSAGVWLFYVQHQFEHTYWAWDADWNLHTGALYGSSHYDLPPVLRWGRLLAPAAADIGKPFRAQQVVGDVLRRDADSGGLGKADCGGFRRALVSKRAPHAKDARGRGHRRAGQEVTTRRHGGGDGRPILSWPPQPQ